MFEKIPMVIFLNRNFLGILQEFFKAVFCTIGTKRAKIGIFTH